MLTAILVGLSDVGVVAGTVWDDIADLVAASVRKRAAIAYAGKDAPQLLPLGQGDIVIVDASDDALRSCATDPAALTAWVGSGAVVKSLPGLHAKGAAPRRRDGNVTAVIGSANASARSRDALLEAAVVSGDESAPAWTYTHAADRFVLPSPSSTEQSIGSRAHHEHTGIHNGQENDSDPERRPRSEP